MKKFAMLMMELIMFITLAACGTVIDTTTPLVVSQENKKDELQIMDDLEASEDFYSWNITGDEYGIEDLTITKRKFDEEAKTDDVYITITCVSQKDRFLGDYHLTYEFYDVGGWILESCEPIKYELTPMIPFNGSQVVSDIIDIYQTEMSLKISNIKIDENSYYTEGDIGHAKVDVYVPGTIYNLFSQIELDYYYNGDWYYELNYENCDGSVYFTLNDSTWVSPWYKDLDIAEFITINGQNNANEALLYISEYGKVKRDADEYVCNITEVDDMKVNRIYLHSTGYYEFDRDNLWDSNGKQFIKISDHVMTTEEMEEWFNTNK